MRMKSKWNEKKLATVEIRQNKEEFYFKNPFCDLLWLYSWREQRNWNENDNLEFNLEWDFKFDVLSILRFHIKIKFQSYPLQTWAINKCFPCLYPTYSMKTSRKNINRIFFPDKFLLCFTAILNGLTEKKQKYKTAERASFKLGCFRDSKCLQVFNTSLVIYWEKLVFRNPCLPIFSTLTQRNLVKLNYFSPLVQIP